MRRRSDEETPDPTPSKRSRPRVVALLVLIILFTVLIINRQAAVRDMELTGAIVEPPQPDPTEVVPAVPTPPPAKALSAQETVLEAIRTLRDTQDPTSIFVYIDWQSVYDRLTPSQRASFAVRSANGMRQYYLEQFTNQQAFLVREMAKRISNFPPEKQKELAAFIKQQREMKVPAPKNPAFAETLYELGKIVQRDATASIHVKSLNKGKAKIEEVELIRRDGHWRFTCVYLVDDPINLCE